ncbi:MAG: exosortase-associated EpsI family protein [Planctomycetes bacterium]|nr:exosortase-associated EpsI family protein [Planctomycetota bacterium]
MQCSASLGETSPTVFIPQRLPSAPMPSFKRGIGLNFLFIAGVCAVWSWFNLSPPKPERFLQFKVKTPPEGWSFQEIPLGDEVIATLATTDLLNGQYLSAEGDRVSVFLANWSGENGIGLEVLGHRPDYCWLGTGWNFIEINPLPKISIILEGQSIPQTVRLFKSQLDGAVELAAWSALLDGRLCDVDNYTLTDLPKDAGVPEIQRAIDLRRTMGFLLNSVLTRRKPTGRKQFIRVSTHVGSDINESVKILTEFLQNSISGT